MPKYIRLHAMAADEEREVRRLAASRTAEARVVQRAKVIRALLDEPGLSAAEAGRRAGYESEHSGRKWVKRFNDAGVAGLVDEARPGRPVTYTEAVRSALISLAVQKPRTLGYPFERWTLERLQVAFEAREGHRLAASTIWQWLSDEGLDWKRQQSWFHQADHHDPAFVEKRGP